MQRQFYNKKTKEAAYQRFSSSLINEARLMRDGLGDWYFRIRDSGEVISYMEGVYTYRLTRDYPITTGKRSTKPGYAILNMPADYSLTYAFIDLVYQQVPVENVYMERLDNRLFLHMKDAPLRDVPDELARFLQQSVKQGRVRYARDHQAVRIETEEELLSVTLPVDVKDWLRHKSDTSGKSMQDVAAEMLRALFEQERKGGY